jgi:ribA/ribD-fused uncharacterized protein
MMDSQANNLDELRALVASGKRPRFVFFWGHKPKRSGSLGAECFSQWYAAPFEEDGVRYPTSEHYMMAEKARLFGDDERLQGILSAGSPGAAKALGREVRGFRDDVWCRERFGIVMRANLAKFSQSADLRDCLLATRARVLAEASPRDRIWGIGLDAKDPRAENPLQWRGLNLLGFALGVVRERLEADRASV